MATARALLKEVPAEHWKDVLEAIGRYHPLERIHRIVATYIGIFFGIGLMIWVGIHLMQDASDDRVILHFLVLIGASIFGAGYFAALGRPPSFDDFIKSIAMFSGRKGN